MQYSVETSIEVDNCLYLFKPVVLMLPCPSASEAPQDVSGSAHSTTPRTVKRQACFHDLRQSPHYQKECDIMPSNSKKAKRRHLTSRSISSYPRINTLVGSKRIWMPRRTGRLARGLRKKRMRTARRRRDDLMDHGDWVPCLWDLELEMICHDLETM